MPRFQDESFRFPNTDIVKQSPGVCRFVIGNPKAFLDEANAAPAALRGLDQVQHPLYKPLYHPLYDHLNIQLPPT